jgi:ribose/xylose/arabinose/galactoside ABC-type transport system permease subunit
MKPGKLTDQKQAADSSSVPRRSLMLTLLGSDVGTLLALAIVISFFAVSDYWLNGQNGSFLTVRNLRVVLNNTSTVAVAALGMTIIIIAGGIDLSAGTAMTLSATVMAYSLKNNYPIGVAVLLTLGCGVLCGLLNGFLISTLRIVPFIVTLGTMTLFLGLGKILADESTIFPSREQIPDWVGNLCSTRPPDLIGGVWPNLPLGVYLTIFLAICVWVILRYTVFGRYVFALGSNEATARLCGVNIPRMKTSVYSLAGLFVGFGGMYRFGLLKIGNPVEGLGMELKFIAAVVIGGGSLNGGRGSVIGTLAGAAIMGVIQSGCDQLEIPNPFQDIIIGAIIIIAVIMDRIRQVKLSAS